MRFALTMIGGLAAASPGFAQSTLKLTTTSGHPNATVGFNGTSFGDSEAVDIYVDTVDTLLLVSSATGAFSGSVSLPKTTQPGPHYITAIGRRSGDAAQAAYNVTTPWDEQGFGAARYGQNPWENTLDVGTVPLLGPLYGVQTGATLASPVVANGHVYVATSNGVESLSTTSTAVFWKAETGAYFDSTPAIAGNAVYVGSFEGTMYGLSAVTGTQLWATAGGGDFESSPVVSGTNVYVGCDDSKLYAIETTTTAHTTAGTILWTFTTGNKVVSSPAVFNGVVYVGSDDDKIYAITTAGAQLWTYTTGGPVQSSPAVVNGIVYVGSADSKLYAIKADSGTLAWTATTNGPIYSSPALGYGLVYIGSDDGNLYAYNSHTGALQWSVNLGSAFFYASPSVADGVVYAAASEGTLYAIEATTGQILWTYATTHGGYTNPTISDGMVYFNSGDGYTYAFATEAGMSAVARRQHPPATSTLRPNLDLAVTR